MGHIGIWKVPIFIGIRPSITSDGAVKTFLTAALEVQALHRTPYRGPLLGLVSSETSQRALFTFM